jgi:hypothetical protein
MTPQTRKNCKNTRNSRGQSPQTPKQLAVFVFFRKNREHGNAGAGTRIASTADLTSVQASLVKLKQRMLLN